MIKYIVSFSTASIKLIAVNESNQITQLSVLDKDSIQRIEFEDDSKQVFVYFKNGELKNCSNYYDQLLTYYLPDLDNL